MKFLFWVGVGLWVFPAIEKYVHVLMDRKGQQ